MYSKGYASGPQITFVASDRSEIKLISKMVLSQTPKPKLEWPAASHPPTLQAAGEGSGVEPEIAVPKPVFPLSPEVTGRRIRPRQVLMRLYFLVFSTGRFLSQVVRRGRSARRLL